MMSHPNDAKIISATIHAPGTWGSKNLVKAKFNNREEKVVVEYYPDELRFSPEEFVGLTEIESSMLFHKKDIAYLQS